MIFTIHTMSPVNKQIEADHHPLKQCSHEIIHHPTQTKQINILQHEAVPSQLKGKG